MVTALLDRIAVNKKKGFSLLEMTLALSIGGVMLGGIWQLMGVQGQYREAGSLASQAYSVAQAGQSYINANRTTLLALGGLNSINAVVRIKVTSGDTGATSTNVQDSGYLPSSFTNLNSFGQAYALYVQRQDAGAVGVDTSDRLVGLLITTGGATIGDELGTRTASLIGAAGGFIRSGTTVASGTAGGWSIDFSSSAGWSTTPGTSTATEGHMAILTAMLANAPSMGGGSGASSIDQLSDGMADYTLNNVSLGQGAGAAVTSGTSNTALGVSALAANTDGVNNTAIGYQAATTLSNTGTAQNVVAIGYRAFYQSNGSYNRGAVAIGSEAMANHGGAGNTAVGYQAARAASSADGVTAIGFQALTTNTGHANTCVGAYCMLLNNYTMRNTALGHSALRNNVSGSYNTALGSTALTNSTGSNNIGIGYQAGDNLTSGSNNIIIGTDIDAPVATSSNQLNIGNTIYGDLNTDQINIGGSTIVTGIGLDVGTNTSASRLSVGTTAQRPTCTATLEGAQRWNSQTQNPEFCTGGVWVQPTPAWTSTSGTPPTPNPGSGYFVLTNGSWDGNLGGFSGANAKCLSDLTSYDWMGKTDAISRGLLNSSKIKAFLYLEGTAQNPLPLTTYYFAVSNDVSKGGANFSTDSTGRGPNNSYAWSATNYFGGVYQYWMGLRHYGGTSTLWMADYTCCGYSCGQWNTSSSSNSAYAGISSATNYMRWGGATNSSCDSAMRLICMVNP